MRARLAVVKWGDAWGSNTWEGKTALLDPDNAKCEGCTTAGWIVNSNKEGVHMLATVTANGASPLNCFIPKGMIREIKYAGKKFDFEY
jgi:hypothetical protein